MICRRCREGAEALSKMTTPVPGQTDPDRMLFRMTLRLHGQCRGGTWCDCAHVVPGIEYIRAAA